MRVAKRGGDDYSCEAMALSDRTYMRDDRPYHKWSAAVVILLLNIAVFFVQYSKGRESQQWFLTYGALSVEGLKNGFVWQFLTYQFLHGGFIHLVLNSMALYFFGRPVEEMLGTRMFLRLYLLSGFVGGLVQVGLGLISGDFGGPMVGASAGIFGLIAAFSILSPDSTILLAFVIPLRARYFLPIIIALSVLFLFVGSNDGIAHGAHLGGILFGVAYLRWLRHATFFSDWWRRLQQPRRSRPLVKVRFPKSSSWTEENRRAREAGGGSTDFISTEVDPILEKISAHGFQSLTEPEKKILEAARARLEKK
jgi:membrane associated rhomboid family serine protease